MVGRRSSTRARSLTNTALHTLGMRLIRPILVPWSNKTILTWWVMDEQYENKWMVFAPMFPSPPDRLSVSNESWSLTFLLIPNFIEIRNMDCWNGIWNVGIHSLSLFSFLLSNYLTSLNTPYYTYIYVYISFRVYLFVDQFPDATITPSDWYHVIIVIIMLTLNGIEFIDLISCCHFVIESSRTIKSTKLQ